jgi:hypothetical protein
MEYCYRLFSVCLSKTIHFKPQAIVCYISRVVHVDGLRLCLWTVATNGPLLFIPQVIRVRRATVECCWQRKGDELGEKPYPVPLCPSQIPFRLIRVQTWAFALRGRRLTVWAMAQPLHKFCCSVYPCANDCAHTTWTTLIILVIVDYININFGQDFNFNLVSLLRG